MAQIIITEEELEEYKLLKSRVLKFKMNNTGWFSFISVSNADEALAIALDKFRAVTEEKNNLIVEIHNLKSDKSVLQEKIEYLEMLNKRNWIQRLFNA